MLIPEPRRMTDPFRAVAKKKRVVELLARHAPELRADRLVVIESGWDSVVYEVDDAWIFRFPRRVEVAERVRVEASLLPELAPTLPAPVPRFEIAVFDDASFVGYRKLPGEPLRRGIDEPELGRRLGEFVSALHRFPVERAAGLGVRADDAWPVRIGDFIAMLEARVVPLLGEADAARARTMFGEFLGRGDALDPVVLHADLGPEHVLRRGSELTGVLDWSDARIGDPALDLAWPLHGTGPRFAAALMAAYGRDDGLRERALFYHRVGPWHEVLYGLEEDRPGFVRSGLDGIRARLP
jgi:aminoglycoside phosphotransferase (APT) family kinase protein